MLPRVRDIRRFGSAALDLCRVAEGSLDVYYERGLNPWDMAAGWLVATEAGAEVTDLAGGVPRATMTLAGPPRLRAALHFFPLVSDSAPPGCPHLPPQTLPSPLFGKVSAGG